MHEQLVLGTGTVKSYPNSKLKDQNFGTIYATWQIFDIMPNDNSVRLRHSSLSVLIFYWIIGQFFVGMLYSWVIWLLANTTHGRLHWDLLTYISFIGQWTEQSIQNPMGSDNSYGPWSLFSHVICLFFLSPCATKPRQ